MIKLFSLKQQKKDGEACPKSGPQKKATAAQLRITKGESLAYCHVTFRNASTRSLLFTVKFVILDLNELNLPKTCETEFPDPNDLLNFKLIISPDEVSKIFSLGVR